MKNYKILRKQRLQTHQQRHTTRAELTVEYGLMYPVRLPTKHGMEKVEKAISSTPVMKTGSEASLQRLYLLIRSDYYQKAEPMVIEFQCTHGRPETESVMLHQVTWCELYLEG